MERLCILVQGCGSVKRGSAIVTMSILKLKPSCKDYIWGGHRLAEEYGIDYVGRSLRRYGSFPAIQMVRL